MTFSPFDNLPLLTKEDALEILNTPVNDLRLSSDYYKAVFHLEKYPSIETEKALITLIKSKESHISVSIAKRKAIEVLARLECKELIPIIKNFLNSQDKYLVESSVLALKELGCTDINVQKHIGTLLEDTRQNLRPLIQFLSKMNATSELPRIRKILDNKDIASGIRGAAIAAIYNLTGSKEQLDELKEYLISSNQNDRQLAVQDIIDANAIYLLPEIIRTPISPSLRFRAIDLLFSASSNTIEIEYIFSLVENVLNDDPLYLNIDNNSKDRFEISEYVRNLFSTDFNQAYFALKILRDQPFLDVWNLLDESLNFFQKDYGALYFLVLFLRDKKIKDIQIKNKISNIFLSCLSERWSKYMKFRPIAIIGLMKLDQHAYIGHIVNWLDNAKEPNWIVRYATLFSIKDFTLITENKLILKMLKRSLDDNHLLVRSKANSILEKYYKKF